MNRRSKCTRTPRDLSRNKRRKRRKHELIQGVRKMRAEINKLCVTKLRTNIDERNPRRREYDNDKFNVTYRYIEGHKKLMKCHSVRFAI